jgi:hypothetical protein
MNVPLVNSGVVEHDGGTLACAERGVRPATPINPAQRLKIVSARMKRLKEMQGFIDASSSNCSEGEDTPSFVGYIAFYSDGRLANDVLANLFLTGRFRLLLRGG